jgi:hypothetical protein
VSRRAERVGCSRQTIYKHATQVKQAVIYHQEDRRSREELLRENQELHEENRQLWAVFEGMIDFPQAKQERFTIAASAMGLSLGQIRELLALLLPAKGCPSRARLGRWVQHWARRAGEILEVLDRACHKVVSVLCLDEIFFRRQPVLVGVEPQSMAWVLGQRASDCKGSSWYRALQPWEQLEYAVSDAGTGLRVGLGELEKQRVGQCGRPLEVGLDIFHIKKEASTVLHRRWKQAESVWVKAEEADLDVERCKRHGRPAGRAANRAFHAWNRATKAFHQAERVESAWRQAEQALELFRPDGRLNDRPWAQSQIAAAIQPLSGAEWAKARRMLLNPRSLTFLDRLHRQLQEAEPNAVLREELVRLYWLRRQRRSEAGSPGASGDGHPACLVQKVVCQRLDGNWVDPYRRVVRVLGCTVRASSVVECMNSVIRMHQARHRTLSQPLLDLKRLYWNCRVFREGKRRHACPYQHLGIPLPTYDWWDLLQMAAKGMSQELSTQQLAA